MSVRVKVQLGLVASYPDFYRLAVEQDGERLVVVDLPLEEMGTLLANRPVEAELRYLVGLRPKATYKTETPT